MKNILIINGSPRKNGNSMTLSREVERGVLEAGGHCESFFLHSMNIKPCNGCNKCHSDYKKDCVIQDDMHILYPKLRKAHAIVISGPVYWFTVSAQTKLFMDRCYALGDGKKYALKGKKIGIVLCYGDKDPFGSGAVNALRTFQDAYHYIGAEIVGMVYGSAWKAGDVKKNKILMEKAYRLGKKVVVA